MITTEGSYKRKQREYLNVITEDPNILHQAVNNLEVISEPNQLTNACAGHCV
jgi:hypothetical protein